MRQGAVTLCWPNWITRGEVSGGSWSTEFPITNVEDPVFAKVARSADTSLTSTQFSVSLDRSTPVGLVCLANHNLTSAAQWKISCYFDTAQTQLALEIDWFNVWPSVYATSELEWEYDNFWLGTYDDSDRENFTSLATKFFDDIQVIQSVKIEIDDQSNPEGYVYMGRVFVSDVWQPTYSAQYGIEYGFEVGTTFDVADNPEMTRFPDVKTPKRTVSFTLGTLSQEEGFRRVQTMKRDQGLHREILYTETTDPTPEGFQKTFIGQLQDVSPLSHPYYQTFASSINLMEVL